METPPIAWGSAVAPVSAVPDAYPVLRYPQLNQQRGIAAIAITVFTVYQFCNVHHFLYRGTPAYTVLNSLDAAVPWFFVLSAFLLFRPIAKSIIDGTPAQPALSFLVRRATRLVPAYYIAVLVVWFTRQQSLPGDWRDLLEHLTFTQVFDEKRIFYTNGPAWAVSVAVYFFLIIAALSTGLPFIARRLKTRGQRVALTATTVGALAAASLAWKGFNYAIAHHTTVNSFTSWFGPMANLDNFAAGMAVAVVSVVYEPLRHFTQRECTELRVCGFIVLAAAFATRQATSWSGVYFTTECALGFACLVAVVVMRPSTGREYRDWRGVAWLGTTSYGIYLWHEPVLLALNGWHGLVRQSPNALLQDEIVVLAGSVLVGSLSFLIIERPVRQLAAILRRRPPEQ